MEDREWVGSPGPSHLLSYCFCTAYSRLVASELLDSFLLLFISLTMGMLALQMCDFGSDFLPVSWRSELMSSSLYDISLSTEPFLLIPQTQLKYNNITKQNKFFPFYFLPNRQLPCCEHLYYKKENFLIIFISPNFHTYLSCTDKSTKCRFIFSVASLS